MLLSPLQAQDLHITLFNGYCDGDNEVTLLDVGIVVNAFWSTPNDPNWDPRADLDGDCEVTLFDYGMVVRHFGAIGAEPFDPALPRQPAPSEGYALQGSVELQGWVGAEQPVRIEALREDDPDQIVYWMEVQSGDPFTLHLPQSGLWWVKVSGMPHALTAQRSAKKAYQPGDPVTIIHAYPPSGETGHLEKFGDASVHEGAILLRVHVFDYDDVTYTSADGSVELKNREREIFHRLRTTWEVQSGGGQIWYDHFGLYAWYTPPALQNDEPSREVTLVCKVYDETVDPNRRDVLPEDEGGAENGSLRQAALSLLRFNLVKEPTIDTITCAVINERGEAVGVSSPIASGVGPDDEVRLRFTFTTRRNKTLWELHSVQWQVPWAGTTSGSKGEIFTTEPIPLSEAHDFFDVTVTATFRRLKPILPPPPEPEYEYVTDTKSRRFPLCFSKTDHDEWNNNARGESVRGVLDPPNWFDGKLDHARHWGHVLDGFGEMDAALAGGYVVYYADKVPDDPKWWYLRGAHALFDWQGLFAPTGHQYKESYRGRIYLFGEPLLSVTDYLPEAFTDGLVAGGIDHVGRVLAHEFAHRNLWLQPGNWEGFTNAQIGGPQERGGPGHWFPGERRWGYDRDEDKIRDGYERLVEQEYHCLAPPPNLPDTADFAPYLYAVAHWWAGDQTIKNRREYIDFEMHAYLWGTWGKPGTVWKGYRIGSKDTEDWSTDGRNDFYK